MLDTGGAGIMLIEEFCGGKAGWNDRASFIDANRCHHPNQNRPHSDFLKSMAKARPKCFAICPSILGDLPSATPPSLPMQGFLESLIQYTPTSSNWSLW